MPRAILTTPNKSFDYCNSYKALDVLLCHYNLKEGDTLLTLHKDDNSPEDRKVMPSSKALDINGLCCFRWIEHPNLPEHTFSLPNMGDDQTINTSNWPPPSHENQGVPPEPPLRHAEGREACGALLDSLPVGTPISFTKCIGDNNPQEGKVIFTAGRKFAARANEGSWRDSLTSLTVRSPITSHEQKASCSHTPEAAPEFPTMRMIIQTVYATAPTTTPEGKPGPTKEVILDGPSLVALPNSETQLGVQEWLMAGSNFAKFKESGCIPGTLRIAYAEPPQNNPLSV